MNISAISPSFQGRRDNIDAMINMDDASVRRMAAVQTSMNVDSKKNRKVTNALFYSAPFAAGLAAAMDGGKTKLFSKSLTGLAARAAKGLKTTAYWTAGFAAIDLLGMGRRKLAQNSSEVRNFEKEHPLLSMGATLLAAFGALTLVGYGANKLAARRAPKFLKNATGKAADFLSNNKHVLKMKNGLLKLADKTPVSLKSIGATLVDWAPSLLLLGGLVHSISSVNAENREFAKNYYNLKERQSSLTNARINELKVENDFLKLDSQNREDIEILKKAYKNA